MPKSTVLLSMASLNDVEVAATNVIGVPRFSLASRAQ